MLFVGRIKQLYRTSYSFRSCLVISQPCPDFTVPYSFLRALAYVPDPLFIVLLTSYFSLNRGGGICSNIQYARLVI